MGIRHLYTHLKPYACPETFSSSSATTTHIYIDGPALCHHIYHLIFCSGSAIGGNAFETTLPYRAFALALGSYLLRLESSGFTIAKIFFDSALPASKTLTRLSRLDDSRRKLQYYRSTNQTLRHGTASVIAAPAWFFDKDSKATFNPRTQHLAAPPFIVGAALSWLSAHKLYQQVTETVPGEADPFLAAAAIQRGGIVLTGDSDLLVFGDDVEGWGVVMLHDLSFTDDGTAAKARVFRTAIIKAALKHPLLDVAYQTSLDSTASLSQILGRLARVEQRKKQGAGMEVIPEVFRKEYTLPNETERGRMVKEPRIGELLFLAAQGKTDERKMYLPFLNEDPQRSPSWEVGGVVRALAYSLLFGSGEVKEVFRRGMRITDSLMPCGFDEERLKKLAAGISENPECWWAFTILDEICGVARERNQPVPSYGELAATASMLLPGLASLPTAKTPSQQKWNWGLVHLFAMAQAGWYSLLLLKEVLAFLRSHGTSITGDAGQLETVRKGLSQLPDVLDLFDGADFLGGFDKPSLQAKQLGETALACHCDAVRAVEDSEEAIALVPVSLVNGNGKRPTREAAVDREDRLPVDSKKEKRKRKKRNNADGAAEKTVSSTNRFAALLAEV